VLLYDANVNLGDTSGTTEWAGLMMILSKCEQNKDLRNLGCVAEFMGRIAGKSHSRWKNPEAGTVQRGHAGVGLGDSVPEPLGFIAFTPEYFGVR